MRLGVIDSRLHRETEWKVDKNNLVYTVKKCNIVTNENNADKYVCRAIRETFKGAMDYALGNRAQLEIKNLLSHGDNFCEVLIRVT